MPIGPGASFLRMPFAIPKSDLDRVPSTYTEKFCWSLTKLLFTNVELVLYIYQMLSVDEVEKVVG
jgi:hypothetical protein